MYIFHLAYKYEFLNEKVVLLKIKQNHFCFAVVVHTSNPSPQRQQADLGV